MCNNVGIEFGRTHLSHSEVMNKKILEVGSRDVNGSLRGEMEKLNPLIYMGVDMVDGKGVDEICNVTNLVNRFGKESFDVVISTELMEHVRDWRSAISNIKNVLKPNGILLLTTRSIGFGYHGYPFDFWRFEIDDMKIIFSDFLVETIERDPSSAGVFIKVQKPNLFTEYNLERHKLFSILNDKRCLNINEIDIIAFKIKLPLIRVLTKILPTPVRKFIKSVFFDGKHN